MGLLPKVCIIGAGSSGMVACKAFADAGISFDCFEKSDRAGGNWVFKNSNGMSAAYRSLHINTSRDKMSFADYPMPAHYPDFPHHTLIAEYFENYLDHFDLRRRITFRTEVMRAERTADGIWRITLQNGEQRYYDALCVANGHHWSARWPTPAFPGEFAGPQIHSHQYTDPTDPVDCIGKRVLVVGMGNSALDIACELSRAGVARNVSLSVRRGYYFIPKYFGGETLDQGDPHPSEDPSWLYRMTPTWYRRWRRLRTIRKVVGRPSRYGLPDPDYPYGSVHPTISSEIAIRLGSGDVKPVADIAKLCGDHVRLVDGSEIAADVIIYCTGYDIRFPFFDPHLLDVKDNAVPLFERVIHPQMQNLFFLGLVQPLCAIMPLAEVQAKWLAALLTGDYALPDAAVVQRRTVTDYERTLRGYLRTSRHTIQVPDCALYCYGIRQELAQGRKRARRQGPSTAIPRRAAELEATAAASR
jgi:cation diffusion facilitator CzcD-associated flavoprotein CzcO